MPTDFNTLATFLAVSEERGFTKAAKRLGVSPSAVSHAIRALEEGLGVRLIARTTRSVSLTEAGEQLLERLRPALNEVGESLQAVSSNRGKPVGRVRLLVPRLATSVIAPKLGEISRRYPDILLDITSDDSRRDIVAEGFDAGIHFGEYIQKDMIAVRISHDYRPAIVASPEYLKSRTKPKVPRDLLQHRCVNFRHGTAGPYRWEFEKGRRSLSIAVNGPLIVEDEEFVLRAALDGVGFVFLSEHAVNPYVEEGKLVRVLEDWCQPYPGFFLYYPSRRQQTKALSAVIGVLKERATS